MYKAMMLLSPYIRSIPPLYSYFKSKETLLVAMQASRFPEKGPIFWYAGAAKVLAEVAHLFRTHKKRTTPCPDTTGRRKQQSSN